ncbi:class I SAM-dependent methyltransferase [Nonomuraea sp. NPDC050556]|uniref:class I SAM-dependent methyltransferase n=1 Tax=Nonomuraea sp. NPDC050556 TaxID=3364369 RepID=UPI003791D106
MSELRSVALRGDLFSQRIREQWTEQLGRRLDLLMVGCVHEEELDLERIETRITGVDEDLPAIRARVEQRTDLTSWTLGDLRSVPVRPRSYDVIMISYLLERILHTELVLDRLLHGLRPGGLMLIRMRDRNSAYGLCDRITPGWMRKALWSRLVPAGTTGPLPAIYERVTSRDGMHAFCLVRGLMITDDETSTSGPAMGRVGGAVVALADKLSRGRNTSSHDEVTMVIRKPQNHFARLI